MWTKEGTLPVFADLGDMCLDTKTACTTLLDLCMRRTVTLGKKYIPGCDKEKLCFQPEHAAVGEFGTVNITFVLHEDGVDLSA